MYSVNFILFSCHVFHQFAPLEASYTAEVPEIHLAPNVMPLFRRQYDNNIFTGKTPKTKKNSHISYLEVQ